MSNEIVVLRKNSNQFHPQLIIKKLNVESLKKRKKKNHRVALVPRAPPQVKLSLKGRKTHKEGNFRTAAALSSRGSHHERRPAGRRRENSRVLLFLFVCFTAAALTPTPLTAGGAFCSRVTNSEGHGGMVWKLPQAGGSS